MRTHLRLVALSALFISSLAQAADLIPIEVHRDANCGCCKKWISHLEANGFKVEDHVESDMSSFKQQHGVPPRLASCHTAIINGKFVEGHVPGRASAGAEQARRSARCRRTGHADGLAGHGNGRHERCLSGHRPEKGRR